MLETEKDRCCLLVDELLGEQQIVVKSIPPLCQKIQTNERNRGMHIAWKRTNQPDS